MNDAQSSYLASQVIHTTPTTMFATPSLRPFPMLLGLLLCTSLPLHAALLDPSRTCSDNNNDMEVSYYQDGIQVRLSIKDKPKEEDYWASVADDTKEGCQAVIACYILGKIYFQREDEEKIEKHFEQGLAILKQTLGVRGRNMRH